MVTRSGVARQVVVSSVVLGILLEPAQNFAYSARATPKQFWRQPVQCQGLLVYFSRTMKVYNLMAKSAVGSYQQALGHVHALGTQLCSVAATTRGCRI